MKAHPSPPASDSLFLQHMLGSSNRKNPVVALLEEIDRYGSINQAAKTVGMSYKAAWERIEHVNNLSPEPLMQRQVSQLFLLSAERCVPNPQNPQENRNENQRPQCLVGQ